MSDDYGFYGDGIDGYIHYMQGVDEAERSLDEGNGQSQSSSGGCLLAIFCAGLILTAISAFF